MWRQSLANIFAVAARWLFYVALLFAPWFYGTTTPDGIVRLDWILSASLGCWLIELLCSWRVPRLSWALFAGSAIILALGWWMVVNAASFRDWQYETFVPRRPIIAGAPGSIDLALSAAFMIRVTLLVGSVWFIADSMRRPKFVLELWWVIVFGGTSISLLGLLQKATDAQMIFWARPGETEPIKTFFASYYYHGNAGAFLNLTWPFAAGLALRSIQHGSRSLIRAFLISFVVIDLVAVMANTSRMSQFVGALLLLLLLAIFAPKLWKREVAWPLKVGGAIFLIAVVCVIAYSSQWQEALGRWQTTAGTVTQDERWKAARVGWIGAKNAGLFGFGPGTFRAVFPRFQNSSDLGGTWIFLHQDYLQTMIEWGWLGAAMWTVIFFGGVANGVVRFWIRGRNTLPRYRIVLPVAVIALIGVLIHALVDFPLQIASVQLYAATALGIAWQRRAPG